MQDASIPRRRIGPAVFGQGTLLGIIFGLVIIVVGLLNQFVSGVSSWTTWIVVAAWFITTILSGYLASRRTRRVGAGSLAGLWTGFLDALFTDLYVVVLYLITFAQSNAQIDAAIQQAQKQVQQSGAGASYTITRSSLLTGLIVAGIILLIVSLAFGAAVGAIAGLVGKSAAGPDPVPVPQEPYPPYPSTPQG